MEISEFEKLIAESYDLDDEIERVVKEVLAPLRERVEELDSKILAQLDTEEISSYKSKRGTVTRSRHYQVKVPNSIEQKENFFGWLRDKGKEVYWKYTTVNSQALNSLHKEQMALAVEAGDIEFKIPGLEPPMMHVRLSKRSK